MLLAVGSYFLANVNFAVLFSKLFKKGDVRDYGSGNAGAANMFRVYGLRMGAITFVCDVLKGVLPCVLAKYAIFRHLGWDVATTAGYVAGLFAVVGHIFPVFYKFRGGKGVATAIGVSFSLQPMLSLCLVLPCVVILLVSDRTSIVSLFLSAVEIVWCWVFYSYRYDWQVMYVNVDAFCCLCNTLMFALVIYAHRNNIVRICKGTENRTGIRKALRGKSDKIVGKKAAEDFAATNADSSQSTDK